MKEKEFEFIEECANFYNISNIDVKNRMRVETEFAKKVLGKSLSKEEIIGMIRRRVNLFFRMSALNADLHRRNPKINLIFDDNRGGNK